MNPAALIAGGSIVRRDAAPRARERRDSGTPSPSADPPDAAPCEGATGAAASTTTQTMTDSLTPHYPPVPGPVGGAGDGPYIELAAATRKKRPGTE